MHSDQFVKLLMLSSLSLGCGEGADDLGDVPEPVPWTVAETPDLSIGVVEGDSAYQFFGAASATRAGDLIVVANTGTNELRFFDSTGEFLNRAGRSGGGPGEFESLGGVYAVEDTVVAYEQSRRVSRFTLAGEFLGSSAIAGDPGARYLGERVESPFPFETWLHARSFVLGVPAGPARAPARRALGRLPAPPSPPGYWLVRVDRDLNLWLSDGPDSTGQRTGWTVYDTLGASIARVRTPQRFEPFEITADDMLGRWRDELGVEFVRVYALNKPAAAPVSPTPPVIASTVAPSVNDSSALAELRGLLRNAVVAQEMYFVDNLTYTGDAGALDWDLPDGVWIDFLAAMGRGWIAVIAHRDLPVICAIAVGEPTPPGWFEGSPVCSGV